MKNVLNIVCFFYCLRITAEREYCALQKVGQRPQIDEMFKDILIDFLRMLSPPCFDSTCDLMNSIDND